jgi:uncharacterized repeat protein (TIGR01451 family)
VIRSRLESVADVVARADPVSPNGQESKMSKQRELAQFARARTGPETRRQSKARRYLANVAGPLALVTGALLVAAAPAGAALLCTTPAVDLSITKTADVTTYSPGAQVVYTVKVSNGGPATASHANVSDTLPTSITGASWTCAASSGARCTASGSGNIADTVTIPSDGTVVYTVTGTVVTGTTGNVTNTATVVPPAKSTDTNCAPAPEAGCSASVTLTQTPAPTTTTTTTTVPVAKKVGQPLVTPTTTTIAHDTTTTTTTTTTPSTTTTDPKSTLPVSIIAGHPGSTDSPNWALEDSGILLALFGIALAALVPTWRRGKNLRSK